MRGRKLAVLAALWLAATLAAHADTKVALVSTCDRKNVEAALALVETELGRGDGVALVERALIQRVLGEQQRCELFDGRRSVELGRLLHVELFAAVENLAADQQAGALVVFDARFGVRLWDAPLPVGRPAEIAESIALGVRFAAQKCRARQAGLKTVCLAAVRNLDLPAAEESRVQSLGLLLERQLLAADNLAVLERRRLQQVNEERNLPGAATTNLFPALVTMDLEVSRGGATLLLGDNLGKLSVTGTDPVGVADALARKVVAHLRAGQLPGRGDRDREADRFFREAEYLGGHDDLAGALAAVESAVALAPTNALYRGRLARHLAESALRTNSAVLASRALDLCTILRAEEKPAPAAEDRIQSFVCQPAGTPLRVAWRDYEIRVVMEPTLARVRNGQEFYNGAALIWQLQKYWRELTPNPESWTADMLRLLEPYLKLAETYAPASEWMRYCNQVPARLISDTDGLPPAQRARFQPLFARMETHPDPLLQIYGRIANRPYAVARAFARTQIAALTNQPVALYRALCYSAALDAIDLRCPPADRLAELQELFDFMLARRDCELITARRAIERRDLEPAIRLSNCDRLLALVRSPNWHDLNGNAWSWNTGSIETELLAMRRALAPEELVPPPWTATTTLLTAAEIREMVVAEDQVFALVRQTGEAALSLVAVPLKAGNPRLLGTVPEGHGLCWADSKLYLAVNGKGVWAFPTAGGQPTRHDKNAGFVDDEVETLAVVAGKLYAALRGHSLIMGFDLGTRTSQVIVSGRRKERATPLDDQPEAFGVDWMLADPPRGRLLFHPTLTNDLGGFWQISVTNNAVTQLFAAPARLHGITQYREGGLLCGFWTWFQGLWTRIWTPYSIVEFDLATGLGTTLAAYDWRPATPGALTPPEVIELRNTQVAPLFAHAGTVWNRARPDELDLLCAGQLATKTAAQWDRVFRLDPTQAVAMNRTQICRLSLPTDRTPAIIPRPPLRLDGRETNLLIAAFHLSNARVESNTVQLATQMGRAEQVFELPAGRYELLLQARRGSNANSSARFVLNNGPILKLGATNAHEFVPWTHFYHHRPVVAELAQPGPLKILLTTPDPDVCLQSLTIRPAPPR